MKAGIIGYGFVGQAVHAVLDCDVAIYDKFKGNYFFNDSEVMDTDIVFVCVPTPDGKHYQESIVETLDLLVDGEYEGLVVVKSTIMHHVLEMNGYHERLNLCFNPEFLNQNTSIEDSLYQETIILGGDIAVTKRVKDFYENHSCIDAVYEFCTIKEACDFKYTRNLYGAFQVLFWEMIQDTTGNARKMSNLYKKIPYKTLNEKVGMDGFRGFGGACFPKDVSVWNKEHDHMLTKTMLEYNNKLKG